MISIYIYLLVIYIPMMIIAIYYKLNLPPFNSNFGYRTGFSRANEEQWNFANKMAPNVMLVSLQIFLAVSLLTIYLIPAETAELLIALFYPLLLSFGIIVFAEIKIWKYIKSKKGL